MGRWVWNTRVGTYQWREANSVGPAWVMALLLTALFAVFIVVGLAILRHTMVTDSSDVARVVAAGDMGSLLAWVGALGQWLLAMGVSLLQQFWPILLITVPGLAVVLALRKG
jgi:hypothetical protein